MRSVYTSIFVVSLLISCRYNDLNPPLALPEDMVFIMPDSSYQFKPNVPVDWKFIGNENGSFSSENIFTAGSQQAAILVEATSKIDGKQKKSVKIIISTHAQALQQINKGGYALYFRHASATNGTDYNDPNNPLWYLSCDSTVARQLNYPQGYQEATAIGSAMRNMEFQADSIYSSEFCRVKKTALFMNEGTVTASHKLTFSMDANIDGLRYASTLKMLNVTPSPGKIRILVGHVILSNAPVNDPLTKLQWGDAAIYQITNGEATYISTISKSDWMALQ